MGKAVEKAWRQQASRGRAPDVDPDLLIAVRLLLSLPYWRRCLNATGALGAERRSLRTLALGRPIIQTEAAEFAETMAKAVSVLIRPWSEGRVRARTELVSRAIAGLLQGLDFQSLRFWAEAKKALDEGDIETLDAISFPRNRPADDLTNEQASTGRVQPLNGP